MSTPSRALDPAGPARRNGAELLEDLTAYLSRYVAFPSVEARDAVALWCAHTHAVEAFDSTPRLAALSPEKGSGKTRLLETMGPVVRDSLHFVNLTAAVMFRVVEQRQPTLLFDEADAVFGPRSAKDHEDVRALVNAGHRRGAVALRMVGEGSKMEPREFRAFTPVALAGLGDLPETILQRSVIIRMRRRAPDETVQPFRAREAEPLGRMLGDRLGRWCQTNFKALAACRPVLPPGVTDRPADVWEPLLAVAEIADGEWPERAQQACSLLVAQGQQDDGSLGVRLLGDIYRIFERMNVDRLTTDELLRHLCDVEEAPWGDLRGRLLDARGLARRLRPYGVHSGDHRFPEGTKKGYLRSDFADAWRRYLPAFPEAATGATEPMKATTTAVSACGVAFVAPVAPGEKDASHDVPYDGKIIAEDSVNRYPECFGCGERTTRLASDGTPRCDGCEDDLGVMTL